MKEFDRLIETWINGNRKDVLDAVERMKPLAAALFALRFGQHFDNRDEGAYDHGVFGRMLEGRLS